MKKKMSILIVSLMLTHVMLATVHIHYLQKSVYETGRQQWGDWQNKANAFCIDSTTLSIVNLSTKSETVYVRQGEAIGGYNERGNYYRLFEAQNEKGQKCLFFLYSDRNVGLLFKCEEAGVIIQYAGY